MGAVTLGLLVLESSTGLTGVGFYKKLTLFFVEAFTLIFEGLMSFLSLETILMSLPTSFFLSLYSRFCWLDFVTDRSTYLLAVSD